MDGDREDCIFCKIANGDVSATFVRRDGDVVAIEDLNPQAPEHLLVLPVRHYRDLGELVRSGDARTAFKLLDVASDLGRERGAGGFRVVSNNGADGGQTVDHLHLHVLAGRPMGWPPG